MVDANVKLRLDTKQAKSELRGLNKLAAGSLGGVGGGIARGAGRAGSAGVGAVRGAVSGSITDIAGGAMAPILNRIKSLLFGGKDLEASAIKEAFTQFSPATLRRFADEGGPRPADERVFEFRRKRAERRLGGARKGAEHRPFMTNFGKTVDRTFTGVAGPGFNMPGLASFGPWLKGVVNEAVKGAVKHEADRIREQARKR